MDAIASFPHVCMYKQSGWLPALLSSLTVCFIDKLVVEGLYASTFSQAPALPLTIRCFSHWHKSYLMNFLPLRWSNYAVPQISHIRHSTMRICSRIPKQFIFGHYIVELEVFTCYYLIVVTTIQFQLVYSF